MFAGLVAAVAGDNRGEEKGEQVWRFKKEKVNKCLKDMGKWTLLFYKTDFFTILLTRHLNKCAQQFCSVTWWRWVRGRVWGAFQTSKKEKQNMGNSLYCFSN